MKINIFFLDTDIIKNCEYHCDKHVVKMIIEYTQILSTVCRLNGIEAGYKKTHSKHPSVVWANESLSNYIYLKMTATQLCKEYTYRYGRVHRSSIVLESLPLPNIEDLGVTLPKLAMPNDVKDFYDPIKSYRNYYIVYKRDIVSWRFREVPEWFNYEGRRL